MAETSWPFDGGTTYEDGWAQMARLFAPSCVEANSLNQLNYVNSSGFVGALDSGSAYVRGFAYLNSSSKSLTHGNPPATAGQSRNDLVVLRLDRSANQVTAIILPGSAATTGSQVDPAITQNDLTGVWDLPIWRVVVTNGATSLGAITDLRGLYQASGTLTWNLLTGWAAGGTPAPGAPVAWAKDPATGIVRMRGQLNATTTFAPSGVVLLATTPAALIPASISGVHFSCAINFASTNNPARITIASNIMGYFASGQASWMSFDNVSYQA